MWELIEIDPETGEEYQLVATGTKAKMTNYMIESLVEVVASGDEMKVRYRVQPAS